MNIITFSQQLDEWKKSDPKTVIKIASFITEIASSPLRVRVENEIGGP